MAEDMVTIATFRFEYEAEAAKFHLEEKGIPAFIAGAEAGVMQVGILLNNIKLDVAQSDKDAAAAILARAEEARRREPSEEFEETDSTSCMVCGTEIPEDESKCPSCGWSYEAGEDVS